MMRENGYKHSPLQLLLLTVAMLTITEGVGAGKLPDVQPRTSIDRKLKRNFLNVNNGPIPYRADLGTNTVVTGGIDSDVLGVQANASRMTNIYRDMGVEGIRTNDQGGAFDMECMFPVKDLNDIPNPEDVAGSTRWNWKQSDEVFSAMLKGGFAPLLKLGAKDWKSLKWAGQSHTDFDSKTNKTTTKYVIPTRNPPDGTYCALWPAMAPVYEKIGEELIATIVDRYNDESRWAEDLAEAGLKGPPLEQSTWGEKGFAAVEIQNEYNTLTCFSTGDGDTTTEEGFAENCGGPAYLWGSRYWDGTPEQAYENYIRQARRVKKDHENVRVGGLALATGMLKYHTDNEGGLVRNAGNASVRWIENFLNAIQEANAPLDYLSWHGYNTCETPDGEDTDCSEDNPNSMVALAAEARGWLDSAGFNSTPMIVSEWNIAFGLNPGNSGPGTLYGPAYMAATLAQLTNVAEIYKLEALFVVNGVDGAFLPLNTLSFPLFCEPIFKTPVKQGDLPKDMDIAPEWSNGCAFGDSNSDVGTINSANGMGLTYQNGDMKPSGALFTWFLSNFAGMVTMQPDSDEDLPRPIEVLAVVDGETNSAMLLLANASPHISSEIPALSQMYNALDGGVLTDIEILIQHVRGLPMVGISADFAPLLNNGTAGTMQLQGDVEIGEKDGLYSLDTSITLPPTGVVLMTVALA